MSFAVFFPNKTGANQKHFEEAGLADLLGDKSPTWSHFTDGPNQGEGLAAHWLARPAIAEEFAWTKFVRPSGIEFYLGRGDDLSPASLARPTRQLGEDLVLGDGRAWHIPHARQLPSVLQLDGEGHWRGKIAPTYQAFYERAWQALDWFQPNDEGVCSIDYQDGADFVALALSINYRVNRDVASWLGLVRSDLLFRVVEIVTQFRLVEEKKTLPPGSPTSAGDAA